MEKIAEFLLNSIVNHPEKVKVDLKKDEDNFSTLILRVSPEDIGKVIGKKGKTVKALTSLIRVKAKKAGERVNLEIQENKD